MLFITQDPSLSAMEEWVVLQVRAKSQQQFAMGLEIQMCEVSEGSFCFGLA